MRTGLRNALVLSLLVAAAALTWYWSRPAPERGGAGGEQGPALGYSMLDAVLTSTNADGATAFEIRTARLTELPAEDRVVFEDIVVAETLEGSGWRVSADSATGPSDGSVLDVEGNVVVRLERGTGEPYELRMPRLELERSSRVARARGSIELTVGTVRLTAEALEIDLNARRLRLESVRGMRTSQLTSAVAAAALSAAAGAQDAPEREQVGWKSMECAEECTIKGFWASRENWRLDAGEAHVSRLEAAVLDGEIRLADVKFTFDDLSLTAPSAVFEFANDVVVKAALLGDSLQFDSAGARFTAQRIVFTFDSGEIATAEISGDPAVFEDFDAPATGTAETIAYDYREREVRVTGPLTFNREGRVQLRCLNADAEFRWNVETNSANSGPCSLRGSRDEPAAQNGAARGGRARDSAAAGPAPDGTP